MSPASRTWRTDQATRPQERVSTHSSGPGSPVFVRCNLRLRYQPLARGHRLPDVPTACPQCGAPAAPDARFCAVCGGALAGCPTCGSAIPVGARFCPSCGRAVIQDGRAEERKVVTVLFADLVGSTAMAERRDPERDDRLTGACNKVNCTGSGLTGLAYTYDPVGNRVTQVQYGTLPVTTTYKYNPDDQLCWTYVGASSNPCSTPPPGATNYTFDANGNETGAGSTTYAYDLENRMTSATVAGTTTTYAYDGDGNRVSATTGGSTTGFLWDINEPLSQLALERSGGSTIRDYSYGIHVNSMTTNGSNYFYLLDAYSNVANLTSSTGGTEWTYANDPFGTATGTKNDPNAPTNLMRFDHQYLDSPTGLYDLRARTYDPNLGRLLQIDPIPGPIFPPTRLPTPTRTNAQPSGVMPQEWSRSPLQRRHPSLLPHPCPSLRHLVRRTPLRLVHCRRPRRNPCRRHLTRHSIA